MYALYLKLISKRGRCTLLSNLGKWLQGKLIAMLIFYYDIFPETKKTLGDHGVTLHHLCTWWDVLAEAKAQGAFDAETLAGVEAFLNNPRAWQDAHKKA